MRGLVVALAPVIAPVIALPLPALADCAGEVAALFDDGPLDPFVRPNRREVTVTVAPDGSETPLSDVLWDGVTRSVNCTPTICAMQIDTQMWMKPAGMDAWTEAPSQLPDDPEAFAQAIVDDMAANLSDPACLGAQTLDGQAVTVFRYRTKTEPNEFGSWWGGLFTAFIADDTGRLVRLEETETVASWAAGPDPAVKVTTVTYDDGIVISAPEG